MSDIAIRVEHLGKLYRIGAQQERYKTLRETLVGAFTGALRRIRNSKSAVRNQYTIWALKDVSFEVKQGEVVGIIGRNGAGKSTLLKILAHITEPTEGRVRLRGRVGSLLEVGTGFSQELTGRENIYLNGAILGMKKAEIERKFDEIVAFAEIEKFLDTPVKRYSTGMYVRLAFAVAAHLETEILLVDEVLAVGDSEFQKKCLNKMGNVAEEGRTVLFVSHNMGAVTTLCGRGLLLSNGRLDYNGISADTVKRYSNLSESYEASDVRLSDRTRRYASPNAHLTRVIMMGGSGSQQHIYQFAEPMRLRIVFEVKQPIKLGVEVLLRTYLGQRISWFATSHFHGLLIDTRYGENAVDLVVPSLPLAEGLYSFDIGLSIPNVAWLDLVEDACQFSILASDPGKTGFRFEQGRAVVYINHDWEIPSSKNPK
jgi:lipopolysaccharide transport system ATP-binding protein